jgi:hypothetical protein
MTIIVRSAEKDRVSTCPLADVVAKAVLTRFHQEKRTATATGQAVLAGVVAIIDSRELHVISMGLGNKFLDAKNSNTVRDMHAEILARRAFKRWLIDGAKRRTELIDRVFDSEFVLRPNVRIILYVSSAPCGNACIRRWATAGTEKPIESLGVLELPRLSHPAIFLPHAKSEGQTEITTKGGVPTTPLSCSDKILKWNVLGLQGVRLAGLAVVKLAGIVIGRKFVRQHAERAFCCRLNSRKINSEIKDLFLTHPVLMSTSVKLDESAFEDNAGAVFSAEAGWWVEGREWDTLDGLTGSRSDGTPSSLCRELMYADARIPPPPTSMVTLANSLTDELDRL